MNVKTPRMEVPVFDGNVEKWATFRDLFVALIHDNKNLNNIEKFKHLETALQANVLTNFRMLAESYEAAWAAVKKRYEDKRKILSYHLDAIFGLKHMNSNNAEELR